MAVFNRFDQLSEDLAHKVHDLSADEIIVLLTNVAPVVATGAVAADITEIDYTNLSSRVVTRTSSGQTAGVYTLVLADLVLTATGAVGPFRYAVLANNTPVAKPLLGYYDRGESVTLQANDTLTLDFSAEAISLQ
ncbi:MAG: hypothetical protein ACU0B7_03500 [Paracoccaceae bacterium]